MDKKINMAIMVEYKGREVSAVDNCTEDQVGENLYYYENELRGMIKRIWAEKLYPGTNHSTVNEMAHFQCVL